MMRNMRHMAFICSICGITWQTRVVLCRSLNTAWLSVASSVAALVIPAAYGVDGSVEWVAICLAAIFTALGAAQIVVVRTRMMTRLAFCAVR